MNNKLFTFLDPLLGYIDNGRFFREPFRWLYVIFAVLNLLFPIFILAKVIEMDFFKYAEGKLILSFCCSLSFAQEHGEAICSG